MGKPRAPQPVLLFAGALYTDREIFLLAKKEAEGEFGPAFMETEEYDWHSGHYRDELGWPIKRKFLFFDRLMAPVDLSGAKLRTNELEAALAIDGRRRVNLDPGYITLAKLVLASTKDYGHRIYLREGIYAEVTLVYSRQERTFKPLANTFADYRDKRNIKAFTEARNVLKGKLLSLEDLEKGPE
jgi:hypothetical protein